MKISIMILFFLLIAHCLHLKTPEPFKKDQLMVWNVGQGQMVTYVSQKECHHFDIGGESQFFPEKKIFKLCRKKKNKVSYTHWDLDHINFSSKMKRIFPSLCRVDPALPMPIRKRRMIQKIPLCGHQNNHYVTEIPLPKEVRSTNSNESSRIFVLKNKVLIPGDSTKKMEYYWSPLIKSKKISILVLGHHGSKTSTSSFLLKHLPDLKLAISSARRKRYNHPHPTTVRRLRMKGIQHVSTETFGYHIRIPLETNAPKPLPY